MTGTFNAIGERQDIEIRRGVDFVLLIEAFDEGGSPVDLTGAAIEAAIKAASGDTVPVAVFAGAAGSATNQYTLTLSNAQTLLLPQTADFSTPARLFWDAKIVWADSRIDPAYYGYVLAYPGITL